MTDYAVGVWQRAARVCELEFVSRRPRDCREFLELAGYTVIDAKDGADALTLAEKYTGKIDLLVTDMVMPESAGAN